MTGPLRVLVLGGTSWLGGTVAEVAVERGHRVSCLARGESGTVPGGATHVVADRWRPDAYEAVAGQDWDAVLDVSWQPELVRSALEALAPRARHWLYVSSISVYADHSIFGGDESSPVVQGWTGSGVVSRQRYPGAKVSCETLCREALPEEHFLIARAGLIVGYGDRSDRFGYWPARFARAAEDHAAAEVLVPPRQTPVQVIDVKDLATWLVDALQRRIAGTFDAVGAPLTFADVVGCCSDLTEAQPLLVDPGDEWLEGAAVEPWAGPESLPLWLPSSEDAGHARRSGEAARRAGLSTRPLSDSVADALRWEQRQGLDRPRQAGLSATRERALLQLWRQRPKPGQESTEP